MSKKIFHFIIIISFLLILTACGKKSKLQEITLNETELKLSVNDTYQLVATGNVEFLIEDIKWSSTNNSVATVDDSGLVKALATGSTEIKAEINENITASCWVEVIKEDLPNLDYRFYSNFDSSTSEIHYYGDGVQKIDQGVLEFNSINKNSIIGYIEFSSSLKGNIVVEMRVKIGSQVATNIISLMNSDVVIAELFAESGIVKYHNGTSILNAFNYSLDTWYDIRMVLNIVDSSSDYDKGYFDLYVNNQFIKECEFYNGGPGLEDNIKKIVFGLEKPNGMSSYDYLSIYEGNKPELSLGESNVELLLNESPEYTFKYLFAGTPTPQISIICSNKEKGYTLNGDKVLFTEAGIYYFTILAHSKTGIDEKTVKITVNNDYHPGLLYVEEEYAVVILSQNSTYQFKYQVEGGYPTPKTTITSNSSNNYKITNDIVEFSEPGEYVFTINTANDAGSSSDDVKVIVKESEVIMDEDFNSTKMPNSFSLINKGNGTVNFNGTAMNIVADGSANSSFVSIPFTEQLSGIIVCETKFMVTTPSFSNALFFYNDDSANQIVVALAFQDGNIRYHDGAWKVATSYQLNTWYEIKMVLDTNEALFKLYLNDSYIGTYGFREPAKRDTITKLFIGSDKTNTDMYYDYLKISYGNTPKLSGKNHIVTLDLETNNIYNLNYEISKSYPTPKAILSCDQISGYTINENTIVFTGAGIYNFTLTVENIIGSDSISFTITVLGESMVPSLDVDVEYEEIDIQTVDYRLKYTVSGTPTPEVTITCNQSTGFTLSNELLNFSKIGDYQFTIKATNHAGSVEKIITISVKEYSAPSIQVIEDNAEIEYTSTLSYELKYIVNGLPDAQVIITCDQPTGFTINENLTTIIFFAEGTYQFTITATNKLGSDSKKITVIAVEGEINYLLNETFSTLPDSIVLSGSGTANIIDDAIRFSASSATGKSLYGTSFNHNLTGTIVYETKVKVSGLAFTNIMFLYAGNTNVLGVAFENNNIRYQNGTTWTTFGANYELNQWVELKAVIELGTGIFDLYINDVKYSNLKLRNTGEVEMKINNINNIGIDNRQNVDVFIDYIKVYNI